MKSKNLCVLVSLLAVLYTATARKIPEQRKHHNGMEYKLRTHLLKKETHRISLNRELSVSSNVKQNHRRDSTGFGNNVGDSSFSGNSWDEEVPGGVGGVGSFPRRIRIKPFDLLLAPTPVQLQRGDEDLLLQDLQELVVLYINAQYGDAGSSTNQVGVKTTLEYVLFSDIEQNSWTQGSNEANDELRSILKLNGGVASFVGPDAPTEDAVNSWVEAAVNDLFVSALAETRYDYIEHAQYFDTNDSFNPEDVVLKTEEEATDPPLLVNQAAQAAGGPSQNSQTVGWHDIPLTTLLASILAGFVVIIVILVFWIHHNNKVVRVLCLSSRDNAEIVEFGNHAPVSIKHETGTSKRNADTDGENENDDDDIVQQSGLYPDDMKRDISIATQYAIDEASLQGSVTSASEFTIPTVSAASIGSAAKLNGLSFRDPNPFAKNLVPQESFQKERKTHLSKDMMFSKWTGKAPNLDSLYGKRRDESVLKPSYFSAAKEWQYMSNNALASQSSDDDSTEASSERGCDNREGTFRVEQAHENSSNITDGIHVISRGSSKQGTKQGSGRSAGAIV